MCCINIDPQAFLEWAYPILERKAVIRAEVKEVYDAAEKAFYAQPWYKRIFSLTDEFDYYGFRLNNMLREAGLYNLPTVDHSMVDLAKYCIREGKEMPLDTKHDFFRG